MSDNQKHSRVGLRDMTSEDLEMVFHWRNHPEIRKCMFNNSEIVYDAHVKWFKSVKKSNSRQLLIYEEAGIPLGFVNISETVEGAIGDWGFYLSPESIKGTGKRLGKDVLSFAFNEMQLHKICGQVLAFNDKSIGFHKTMGFKLEGILKQQHYDGEKYHDVFHFGLLKSDWCQSKEVM